MQLTRGQRLRGRLFFFAMGLVRRMTLGARVVLTDGERVYLIRHTYVPGWYFPGGGVEPGETAEQSAAREVREETGYRVEGPLELFGFYHNVSPASNRDHVALFLCRAWSEQPGFRGSAEIAEAGWFPLDALPRPLSAGTERRLAEIFGQAPKSATW